MAYLSKISLQIYCSPRFIGFVKVMYGVELVLDSVGTTCCCVKYGPALSVIPNTTRVHSSCKGTDLSKQEDRLPALSGVAKNFEKHNGGEYYGGIWEADLQDQLMWWQHMVDG
jgi:hypothetical protein